MLKRALGAREDVAGEEGAAEAEGPEAERDRDPQLGGAGAVDDGEAPEVGHPDVAEVDAEVQVLGLARRGVAAAFLGCGSRFSGSLSRIEP